MEQFKSCDSRDYTKDPPATLSPAWVIKMRRNVIDASKGSRPWPYGLIDLLDRVESNIEHARPGCQSLPLHKEAYETLTGVVPLIDWKAIKCA